MSAEGLPKVNHPHVEQIPGVQGGRAVIRDTRFPVSSVVQNHRRGLSVDEILREFPELTPAQVYDALSFYYDHREQVDQEITELNATDRTTQEYPPTLRPADDRD